MDLDFEGAQKKRTRQEKEEDMPTNCTLDSLPHEVASDIVTRLPIRSLMQVRFVCKSWEKLTYHPDVASFHLSNALKRGDQCFIFHCDFPIKNLLYFVEFSDADGDSDIKKVSKFQIPFSDSMSEFNVLGSCNGILCLVNSLFEDCVCVYNPFTRDYKELPKPSVLENQKVVYGFGFSHGSSQYKVVRIVYYHDSDNINDDVINSRVRMCPPLSSLAEVCCLGSYKWRSIGRTVYLIDKDLNPVSLNGKIHWITVYGSYHGRYGRTIVSFDLSDDTFSEVPKPNIRAARNPRHNYTLAVLGGCLAVVVPSRAMNASIHIWVMKEYGEKESWVKQFHIGEYFPEFKRSYLLSSHEIWKNLLNGRLVRVLSLLKNGRVLLEYRGGNLVTYDPETQAFNCISFPGLPRPFQTILHVGSLIWVNDSSN